MSRINKWLDDRTGKSDLQAQLEQERSAFVEELKRLQGAVQYLVEDAAYEAPMPIAPENMVSNLREFDSQLVNELIDQKRWDVIGGLGLSAYDQGEAARARSVADSRFLAIYSPLAEWGLSVWTNYGMGDSVRITANNPDADIIFNEFWTAERNADVLADDKLQYLSQFTLQDGNTFLAFFADKEDGRVTVEEIPVDEISEIVTHPQRKTEKLFYKRTFETKDGNKEVYYPDWKAKFSGRLDDKTIAKVLPEKAERADEKKYDNEILNSAEETLGTDVVVMHIAHNRKKRNDLWGWPLMTSASPYVKAHKKFLEDRLTVAASKAMYVRNKRVKGGSRAIDTVRNTIQSAISSTNFRDSNPAAAAGSVEIDNEAITTTEKPMMTGASDAKSDGEMFSWIALLGLGIFPTTAGMDTSRWATALQMDKTLSMQWARYRTFWSSNFQRMVKIVLRFAEIYGEQEFIDENGNPDLGANVNIDTLSLVDFPDVVKSLSQAVKDMLEPYLDNGIIPEQTAKALLRELWLIMLQALGLQTSRDIASESAFGIDVEELDMLPKLHRTFLKMAQQKFKEGDLTEIAEFLTDDFSEE